MVQTATHIFGLALAMSSANAPRIQNRQEGTMSSKATVAWEPRAAAAIQRLSKDYPM